MTLFERLSLVKDRLENWWNFGDQNKPLILSSYLKPNSIIPDTDILSKFWTDLDFIIKRQISIIENSEYIGVALPYHYIDHGSSAGSLILGSEMEFVDKETIWSHPIYNNVESVINIVLDENNFSYKTIIDLTRRSSELAFNHHFVAPFALGGVSDNLAGLYGTENLLIDMVNKPHLVKRALNNMKNIWINNFVKIQNIIQKSKNPGGIGWIGIWAPGTTFPIQEDFSYMISPEMFKAFLLPHIVDIAESMDYAFYHLDGVGALPHLDLILQIDKIKVVQWVPGAGKEKISDWYDVIKKIIEHKKSCQVFIKAEEIDDLVKNVGTKGLLTVITDSSEENVKKYLSKYLN